MHDTEAKEIIINSMQHFNVDVKDLTLSRISKNGIDYIQPENRQLHDGTWLPILDWSFVSFDPTRKGFRIEDI